MNSRPQDQSDPQKQSVGPPLQVFECEAVPVSRTDLKTRGGSKQSGPDWNTVGPGAAQDDFEKLNEFSAQLAPQDQIRLVQDLLAKLPRDEAIRLANELLAQRGS